MSKGVSRTNTFVSKKLSCVRWRPVTRQTLGRCTQFVTGSWDDEENCVQLWDWSEPDDEPRPLHELSVQHDVTCISYVSPEVFAVTSAGSDLTLYHHTGDRLQTGRQWRRLHTNREEPVPCTWVSTFEEELVTVGDDGRLCLLSLSSHTPTRVIDEADTCSLYRVQHISHSQVVTGNMRGQIRTWDLRTDDDTPTASVVASQQQCGVTALARHPTQYHVLASGDTDGVICIWDLRQPRYAVTELKSHSGELSELQFHRSAPDSLFSAAQDGALWQWNVGTGGALGVPAARRSASAGAGLRAAASCRDTSLHPLSRDTSLSTCGVSTPWLTLDSTRRYLDVLSLLPAGLLPLNSLDVADDRLVSAGDNQVLHCISHLAV